MPRGKKNPPSQKRDPSSHRTLEQMRKSGRKKSPSNPSGQTPAQIKARGRRNAARNAAIKKGIVKKGDGNDMHHPAGGARGKAVKMSASKNRGHGLSKGKPMAKAKSRGR